MTWKNPNISFLNVLNCDMSYTKPDYQPHLRNWFRYLLNPFKIYCSVQTETTSFLLAAFRQFRRSSFISLSWSPISPVGLFLTHTNKKAEKESLAPRIQLGFRQGTTFFPLSPSELLLLRLIHCYSLVSRFGSLKFPCFRFLGNLLFAYCFWQTFDSIIGLFSPNSGLA